MYGITIKSPDEINKLEPMNTVVVIAVSNGIPEVYEQICEKGHYNIMSARILMNEIFSQVAKALIENQDEINKVAERLIKNCKPKLAISLYHCGEDYYRIPLYLKSIVPEYKFAVRHHKKNHVDTDLYCWIEE